MKTAIFAPLLILVSVLTPGAFAAEPAVTASGSGHFDVAVNRMPARDFFLTLMEGTKENIIVNPDVAGEITLRLNNVSLEQTLQALRDAYGYNFIRTAYGYQISGASQNVRIYQLNYMSSRRFGQTQTFVSGRGGSATGKTGSTGAPGAAGVAASPTATSSDFNQLSPTATIIKTQNEVDFWTDIRKTLDAMLGGGGKAVVQPETGLVIVTAPPEMQKAVELFVRQTEESANRQVLIEAKIVEVQLNDSTQEGINWQQLSLLASNKTTTVSVGSQSSPGVPASPISNPDQLGGVFGLALNGGNFTGILQLLQTQGDVNVLSSPRIAAVNNQKAIIKVGSDEYFATKLSFTTLTTGTNTSVIVPDLELDQFFSGIALDIIPQINGSDVTLHVKPAVVQVTQQNKDFNLGSSLGGTFTLPLAFSQMREADTVVRAESGKVVAIGGLMTTTHKKILATTPFLGQIPIIKYLFQQKSEINLKTELVILLRPMVMTSLEADAYLQQNGERLHLSGHDFDLPAATSTAKSSGAPQK